MTEYTKRRAAQFAAVRERALAWHGEETPGIPIHKFWTQDGWIVTPSECRSAVAIWRRNGAQPYGDDQDERDYWHQWIAFLEGQARARDSRCCDMGRLRELPGSLNEVIAWLDLTI